MWLNKAVSKLYCVKFLSDKSRGRISKALTLQVGASKPDELENNLNN